MTQKELLYVEDAIEHEKNIIEICNHAITQLDDTNIASFMEEEIIRHQNIKDNLEHMLKEKVNE